MFKLLNYILSAGNATIPSFPKSLPEDWRGMPALSDVECRAGCSDCAEVCPTWAITMLDEGEHPEVAIDLGSCIQCGLCFSGCPTGTITENKTPNIAAILREDLVLVKERNVVPEILGKGQTTCRRVPDPNNTRENEIFSNSLQVRTVSTGCSACDTEITAMYGPTYDVERFGCNLVASPRHADALLITGPVSKAMYKPLERCYGAMAEPHIVIAVGTCAISGGVHKDGYAGANGADVVLPVDIYIPGCPPHPWSIIHGVLVAMGKLAPFKPTIQKKEQTAITHFTTS